MTEQPKEMLALREALSNRGIEWIDKSEDSSFFSSNPISRTRFLIKNGEETLSVIWKPHFKNGLLETWILNSDDETESGLTAKQIIDKYVD